MHGSSAESLARLTDRVVAAVEGGADGAELGTGLFGASAVLTTQPGLRRALTDPSTEAAARTGLAETVFGKHLSGAAVTVVAEAAGLRWVASADLADALEQLGVLAIVRAADREGAGDRVEEELFAFGRTVTENHELRSAMSDPARSVADKQALVRGLLEGKAHPSTVALVEQAATGGHLTVTSAIDTFVALAAKARNRLVALVRVAQPLDADEEKRLAAALSAQYDRTVHLNTVVDPSVLGGVHVSVGDEVIDGTVSSRLDEAGRRLAG
ncbi:F0F1 ATP synthase subunit delta [Nocardioides pocheonensis]|jgi:F-type H+-transporting ATPase subunit delta|uniref:ATP synthase subunit delta n=1 Tax=Nocardioides pocheonensis TaxID=661485 RepID=A0A3N0GS62_9ACTN|nr:F0F1 ATP synthase subunit delta [Nocardioides pocheonensis]RNM15323.1 F0F1 ATP synthase subunit delta [Nocardioides pocheonensis]